MNGGAGACTSSVTDMARQSPQGRAGLTSFQSLRQIVRHESPKMAQEQSRVVPRCVREGSHELQGHAVFERVIQGLGKQQDGFFLAYWRVRHWRGRNAVHRAGKIGADALSEIVDWRRAGIELQQKPTILFAFPNPIDTTESVEASHGTYPTSEDFGIRMRNDLEGRGGRKSIRPGLFHQIRERAHRPAAFIQNGGRAGIAFDRCLNYGRLVKWKG